MASDVKRPFLLQLNSSSQEELCKLKRRDAPMVVQQETVSSKPPNTISSSNISSSNRASVCSSESSTSSTLSSASSATSTSCNKNEVSSPSLILPYLYVGDQAQTQIDTISSLNISYILSLQSLPKFLSEPSQTTPPTTPTTAADFLATNAAKPQSRATTTPASSSSSSSIIVRPIELPHENSTTNSPSSIRPNSKTKSPASEQATASIESKIDIIGGAKDAGGLLPSVNSSKDYLVKIKHLSKTDHESPIVRKQQQQNADQLMEVDEDDGDDEDNFDVDNNDDESFAVEETPITKRQIKCDNVASTSSHRTSQIADIDCYSPADGDGDDEIVRTAFGQVHNESDSLGNINDIELLQCNTPTGGAPLQGDDDDGCLTAMGGATAGGKPTTSETNNCSLLKQRCNRLSSSMHRLIRGKCINISDTFEQLLDKFFDETHSFIEEARRNKCNVLVHCKAGISRSPTIAIAYLMKWKRLHLQDAYNFVKRCRPQISPNLNFMGQLVSYERQLQRDRSHLPSPTSSCMPSFNSITCPSASGQHPIESVLSSSRRQEPLPSTLKVDQQPSSSSSSAEQPKRVFRRQSNQKLVDATTSSGSNLHDSNKKRARVRCFFRLK